MVTALKSTRSTEGDGLQEAKVANTKLQVERKTWQIWVGGSTGTHGGGSHIPTERGQGERESQHLQAEALSSRGHKMRTLCTKRAAWGRALRWGWAWWLKNMKWEQNPWRTVGEGGGRGMKLQRSAGVSPCRTVGPGEGYGFYSGCSGEPLKGPKGKARLDLHFPKIILDKCEE